MDLSLACLVISVPAYKARHQGFNSREVHLDISVKLLEIVEAKIAVGFQKHQKLVSTASLSAIKEVIRAVHQVDLTSHQEILILFLVTLDV